MYVRTYGQRTIACTYITHCCGGVNDLTTCFSFIICTINAWCMLQSLEQLSTCMFATKVMCHCAKRLFPHCSLHDTQVYAVTEFPTVSGLEIGFSAPSDLVQFNSSGMNTHRRLNNTVQFIIMCVCTVRMCIHTVNVQWKLQISVLF